MRILFLLFVVLPIVELWLLFKVGGVIGFLPTVVLVLGAGALGVHVLRRQGFNTFQRAQERLRSGDLPGQEIMEGFFIAAAGALLLTPGFITDVIAIVFLLPFTRRLLVRQLLRSGSIAAMTGQQGGFTFMHMGGNVPPRQDTPGRDVYEGEFTREQPTAKPLAAPDSTENRSDK